MDQLLSEKVDGYTEIHRRQRIWRIIVSVLAVVVVAAVVSAQILPAITAEKKVFCGYEEEHANECYRIEKHLICDIPEEGHTHSDECFKERQVLVCSREQISGHIHSDDCYEERETLCCTNGDPDHVHGDKCFTTERILVCGREEVESHQHDDSCYSTKKVLTCPLREREPHEHTDKCYEIKKTLICDRPLHKHTLQCFSNPEADLESRSVWERTIANVELTGNWNKDVLEIAKTQAGYAESQNNYYVNDEGRKQGYTRYGAWYGDSYGDWCAMFCAFCLHYADVKDYSYSSNVGEWVRMQTEADMFRLAAEYTAVPGDLVIFDYDKDGSGDHIGFVCETISDGNKTITEIKTIEGNTGDCVGYHTYEVDNPSIYGYCILPENPKQNKNGQEVSLSLPESTETKESVPEEPVSDNENEQFELLAETENDLTVMVSGNRTSLPFPAHEIQLTAVVVDNPDAVHLMKSALEENNISPSQSVLLDICLWHNGQEIQPIGAITVSFLGMTDGSDDAEGFAFHIETEGKTVENMNAFSENSGEIVFETDHFSEYYLVLGNTNSNENGTGNGNSSDNTTEVTATIEWSDGAQNHNGDSVSVILCSDGHPMQGNSYTVALNSQNHWTYTWTELPNSIGSGYSVEEVSVPKGYEAAYSKTTSERDTEWIRATSLKPGKTYIISNGYDKVFNGVESRKNYNTVSVENNTVVGGVADNLKWTAVSDGYDTNYFYLQNVDSGRYMYNGGSYAGTAQNQSGAKKYILWYDNLRGSDSTRVVWYGGWLSFCPETAVSGTATNVTVYEEEPAGENVVCTILNKSNDISHGGGGGGSSSSIEPVIRKWVDKLDDDDYNLTLSIGAPDLTNGFGKVDVLFVVDTTGSMTYAMDGRQNRSLERWNAIVRASSNVIAELQDLQVDVRYALTTFANTGAYVSTGVTGEYAYSAAGYVLPWTSSADAIKQEIVSQGGDDGNNLGGGTNYESVFYLLNQRADNIQGKARQDARKIILFITDGEPNLYYNASGTDIDDNYNYGRTAKARAIAQASKLSGFDEFYAIGVGSDVGVDLLDDVVSATGIRGDAYSCNSDTELAEALKESLKFTTTYTVGKDNSVWITDTLSDFAQVTDHAVLSLLVRDSDNNEYVATGTLRDGVNLRLDSSEHNSDKTFLSAAYNAAQKKIEVRSNREYVLEPGWSYSVKIQIEPTELAYAAYSNDGAYPDFGEYDTGITSAEQAGFKSNRDESALFSYEVNGTPSSKEFPRPVIQVEDRVVLPETGGIGTYWYTFGGIILLSMSSAVTGFMRRRKLERRYMH